MTIRTQAENLLFMPRDKYPDGQVKARSKLFDDVVIDAGGRDPCALRAVLMLSDVILVAFAPRSLDVWALTNMCGLIDVAKAVRTGLRAMAILRMADNVGRDNDDAIEALKNFPQFDYLSALILCKKAVVNAAAKALNISCAGFIKMRLSNALKD